jgi:hypothetical protein
MAEPDTKCDLCGQRLEGARMMSEMYLALPGEKRIGPQRHQRVFEGNCPEHGNRIVAFPNEGHSTILASRLGGLFKRAERRLLRANLSDQDRRDFQNALNGQYAWDGSDVSRWKTLLARILGRK